MGCWKMAGRGSGTCEGDRSGEERLIDAGKWMESEKCGVKVFGESLTGSGENPSDRREDCSALQADKQVKYGLGAKWQRLPEMRCMVEISEDKSGEWISFLDYSYGRWYSWLPRLCRDGI